MTGAGTGWRRRQAILNYPEAFREPTAEGDHFSTFLGMEHYRRTAHTRFDLKYHFVWITQYYTSHRFRPVREIVEASRTGPATNIISGISVGFETTGATRLISLIQPDNHRSIRVAEKVGFTRDGTIALEGAEMLVYAQARPPAGESHALAG